MLPLFKKEYKFINKQSPRQLIHTFTPEDLSHRHLMGLCCCCKLAGGARSVCTVRVSVRPPKLYH